MRFTVWDIFKMYFCLSNDSIIKLRRWFELGGFPCKDISVPKKHYLFNNFDDVFVVGNFLFVWKFNYKGNIFISVISTKGKLSHKTRKKTRPVFRNLRIYETIFQFLMRSFGFPPCLRNIDNEWVWIRSERKKRKRKVLGNEYFQLCCE